MVDRPPVDVGIKMTGTHPVPPAEGANFFHFTTMNGEVQLLVGSVNLLRAFEASRSESDHVITPEITHRFLMSPAGFAFLKRQIDEIAPAVFAANRQGAPAS